MIDNGAEYQRTHANVADVAKAAGVSKMTVSRVLNGRPDVSNETRSRVLAIMAELGFRPNGFARALKGGPSGVIGLICPATSLFGPTQVLFGVEAAAREAGFTAIITTSPLHDGDSLAAVIERLERSSVEGIVIISPLASGGDALRSMESTVPTIAIWAPSDVGMAVTGVNHHAAAAAATQHLLDLGHPTVHHISGPPNWTGSEQRVLGWRDTLEAAGIAPPRLVEGDWTSTSGYEAGRELLVDPDVTAVFVANDPMALGLYRAASELGRRIPHDLSVVGYDDSPDSQHLTPPLTTVRQDFRMLGARAFARLHATLRDQAVAPMEADVTPTLIIRESTAAPPR